MDPKQQEIEPLHIANYCVCFLDLLGQKNLLAGEGLMPQNKDEALAKFQKILTSVRKLHEFADKFLGKEIADGSVSLQRWSDGVVVYVALGGPRATSATSGIHSTLSFAASMMFFGLAAESPFRGGIDISWGVELYRDELYGPAIANSYLLESECARYPRVVIGTRVLEYLNTHSDNVGDSPQARLDKGFAQECLSMISTDEDGQYDLLPLNRTTAKLVKSVTHSEDGHAQESIHR